MTTSRATRRVFISHSHQDNELVRDIARRLRDAGFEPFVDFPSIPTGGGWKDLIRERLREADTVIFLVTPESLRSPWTMTELGIAEGLGRRVVPVTVGIAQRDLPAPLQTYLTIPFDRLDDAISQLAETPSDSAND